MHNVVWLFLLPLLNLVAEPLKVPQEFYSGYGKTEYSFDHDPLITEITYRSVCDHIIDQTTEWFDPGLVKQGDIICLNIWYLEWFEKEVHEAIQHPYILLTCDVGDWLPHPDLKRLLYDPKLAAWFCRNLVFSYHPKLFQIPMGQNDRLFPDPPLAHLKELLEAPSVEKRYFLYMNHLPRVYGDRDKIVQLFEHAPYCFSRNHTGKYYGQISRQEYLDELAQSYFVISPYGLETDCVRSWEALAVGCIPIVEHTFLDPLFENLPVVFVHEWTEINEEMLKGKLQELRGKGRECAFFNPWRELIKETQKKVRRGDLAFSRLEAMRFSPKDLDDLASILEGSVSVIWRGFLSGVRALELAGRTELKKIHLCDPWLDQKAFRSFGTHLLDKNLLKNQKKISLISFKVFDTVLENLAQEGVAVFCDFSYYRNSFMRDSTLKNWRHSLKQDLLQLCSKLPHGTLICGNMIGNEYVREVLEKLGVEIGRIGNFWFFQNHLR
ncbi:MAG: hypothetical protein A3E80_05095 [Chlamydiae bacterium RIFCSPHIGHO2_12_FULL_49_9]|nr:MAG: hypothetical protein A3E80_05095 [Chlamydiae bacterium RIFCSPHIGHO2_12_FULL_49_9]